MKRIFISLLAGTSLAVSAFGQQIVVANRASSSISVINARTNKVAKTVTVPGANKSEPMYVVHHGREVLVGDRANNQVVAFDDKSYRVRRRLKAGKGIFHMWANERQLWVNNDIDKTTSVIDLRSGREIKAVPTPADLARLGHKPHDVFATRHYAYVSLLGGSDGKGWVIQFSTRTLKETRRAAVGEDPHLWVRGRRLYVASQDANMVHVLDSRTLRRIQNLPVPAAHGIYMPRGSSNLYVTNISGGGKDGLFMLSTWWRLRVRDKIDTKYPIPHNIAALPFGRGIYVTHSGATAKQVTIFRRRGFLWWSRLVAVGSVEVGLNPFGLAYVSTPL